MASFRTGFPLFIFLINVAFTRSQSVPDCPASQSAITIPEGVTEIPPSQYKQCTTLTSIIFPVSVLVVGGSTFESAVNLQSVDFNEGLVNIGNYS